ncbi:MAG: hypothetical protein Kow0074_21230 [Candidatus Zixiibacteriota bacterium]
MNQRWLKCALVTVILCGSANTASAQFYVSGMLAMVARNADVANQHNRTNAGFSTFDATYGRVFFDGRVTDRLSAFVQLYLGMNYSPFVNGAYIRYDHSEKWHLEAGLIPLPVGLWGPRTYPDKNPLVGVPLMYQYKTGLMVNNGLQQTPEEILSQRGTSQAVPIVYDFCWNTGIHGYGSVGPFDFGLALQTGSLGSPSREITYDYPNVQAHISWVPGPGLTIGGWAATGAYLGPAVESQLPAGQTLEDYHQQTIGGLAHAAQGHWDIFAEALFNRFQHPFLGDLDATGGYLDVRYGFAPKWFGAVRIEGMTFSRFARSIDPQERYWEYPLARLEFGLGHRMTHKTMLKAVTQIVRFDHAPSAKDEEIYALQFVAEI